MYIELSRIYSGSKLLFDFELAQIQSDSNLDRLQIRSNSCGTEYAVMYIELSRIYSGWNLVQLQIRSDSFGTESSVMYRIGPDSFGLESFVRLRIGSDSFGLKSCTISD